MSTPLAASPDAYRQSAVLTATPAQLIVMLYDGARRFLHQAAAAMRSGDIALTHNKICRAEDIVRHLRRTLDMEQGEIATQLQAIYVFCQRYMSEARIEQNPEKLEHVSRLLGSLRESWAAIGPE